jgi:hypothetical protein
MLVKCALKFSVFVSFVSFFIEAIVSFTCFYLGGSTLQFFFMFNCIYLSTSIWVFLRRCVMRDCNSPYRGIAPTTHPHLLRRLRKEYSYTYTPPLCFLGLLQAERYMCLVFEPLIVHSYNMTIRTRFFLRSAYIIATYVVLY